MNYNDKIKTLESQCYKVVKHNDIIQKSKFKLSTVEQKTVSFLVSLIKPKEEYPNQIQPIEYEFEIQDYCKVCDIDYDSGKNYKMVRDTLKALRDKSVNVTLPNGTDTSVSWINKYWSNKGTGKARVRFDDDMAPYIFDVRENTTRYELLNILPMQSKYAIRLYEICRSWAGIFSKQYELKELRSMLGVADDELVRYPDFRRYALEIAQREINEHTDIEVNFEPITKGRKTIAIRIKIKKNS
jgi:plasmid replication initiation protein